MAKAKAKKFDLGVPEDDFPQGLFDDFDGRVNVIEFEKGDYGTQIHIVVYPEEFEFESRGMEYNPDDTEGWPQQWFGMGKGEYIISDDMMEIEDGPLPQKQSRAVKFLLKMRTAMKKTVKGVSLEPYLDALVHWKLETETFKHPETKENVERAILYPSGPAQGAPEDDGDEEKEEGPRRRRGGSRRAKREVEEAPPEEVEAEEESDDDSEDEHADMKAAIVEHIGEETDNGEKFVRRSRISSFLDDNEDEFGEEAVAQGKKKVFTDAMVEEGLLVYNDKQHVSVPKDDD
jgi:hypothetical protein|tara:strand:- start:7148 stop:8014 length:867 start_codon:yes stop_codon:yes gene_type:complete